MTPPSKFSFWIRYAKSNVQARVRLFCFAYAGGGAGVFRAWGSRLPPEIEVCPIELPGRGSRIMASPFTRLTPLIEMLAQDIQPYLTMPFAFFGHSMGGLISFELTRQLRRQLAAVPTHLLISAYRAPQLPHTNPPIHQLPDSAFVEALRSFNGTPQAVLENTELMRLMLPTLRADFAVCETYVYTHEEPLGCPISVFGGLQDREVSQSELEAWHKQTYNSFTLRMFAGHHFFLHSAQESLLEVMSQELTHQLSELNPYFLP